MRFHRNLLASATLMGRCVTFLAGSPATRVALGVTMSVFNVAAKLVRRLRRK